MRKWPSELCQKCCLQVQGGDPSPLFGTGETTPAVLGSVPGIPVGERCGHSEASTAQVFKYDQATGASSLMRRG